MHAIIFQLGRYIKNVCFFSIPYLFLVNGYPVRGCIPLVTFDVINTVFQITVAFCQIDLQQISQKVL